MRPGSMAAAVGNGDGVVRGVADAMATDAVGGAVSCVEDAGEETVDGCAVADGLVATGFGD